MGRSSNSKLVTTTHLMVMVVTCFIELIANSTVAQVAPTKPNNSNNERISIVMPDIRPDHEEQYLCMAHRVKKDQAGQYVVGFNPQANAGRVHHMLLYGCQMPGILQRDSPNFVWDCSEMHVTSLLPTADGQQANGAGLVGTSFEQAPVCQPGKQQILYGWALDAPALNLPQGVGFKIGGEDSGIEFLVLQVHYGHYDAFQKLPSLTDNSGLILDVIPNIDKSGITRRAGVLLLFSLGYVPKGSNKHEIWCEIEDDIEIHPFRFRVHTHKLGTRVKGTKISQYQSDNLGYDVDQTSLIGVGDPQEPQMFYPVHDPSMTLTKGDKVYATCEFNNNRDHNVKIGSTNEDEMCNFYMMYWTNSSRLLSNSQCSTLNPQRSYLDSLVNSILF